MALPAPNLDDRRFQELVDEAKRMVMRRCPEWTDHNVSDPGVTLIETFAYMTDLMLYRLNRVPERLYIKFLDLIGLQLFPPTAGRAPVTFWLSTNLDQPMTIPTATRVATLRTEHEESEVFTTIDDLALVPCAYQSTMTKGGDGEALVDRTEQMHLQAFAAFSDRPTPGDALMIGLTEAVPSNAVSLRMRCRIDGVGVDPTNPPLRWEAYDGTAWQECELERDDTGGLNRDGEIVLHVPSTHRPGVFEGVRAGWIRCVVITAEEGQPEYSSSPIIHGVEAGTVGGTVDAVHAEVFQNETIGVSDGTPGQRFQVVRTPILTGTAAAELEVGGDEGWEDWFATGHFASSGPDDKHFRLDAVTGEVCFGPAVREPDGSLRQYGAVPPAGSAIRLRKYVVGGGRKGNVAKGAIRTLKTAIPFIAAVENRRPAVGGIDGENIDEAKVRGPILLRTRNRAVTGEDFEQITREAAPEIARVRCVPAGSGPEAGSVKVLIVPAAPMVRGKIRFEDLLATEDTMQKIQERLEQARLVGTRVLIEPPLYRGVTVVAMLKARPRTNAARIRDDALERLESYFNPLIGGPDGKGWPWGRPVQAGEAYAALQEIRGVDLVEEIRVFGANPVTGERGQAATRIEVEPTSLVFSYEHQVRVQEA